MHHIVPLSWSENLYQFKLIDEWRNLLYVDAYKHALVTQNGNWNVRLAHQDNDLILSDYAGNTVDLEWMVNVLYAQQHLPEMLQYNKELLGEQE